MNKGLCFKIFFFQSPYFIEQPARWIEDAMIMIGDNDDDVRARE